MKSQKPADSSQLSIVIPCYNEEAVLPLSIPPLLTECQRFGGGCEVLLVNNGSTDSTPDKIDSFVRPGSPVRRIDVPVNRGFGWGIICGLKEARGRYVGYACADGQVSPPDIIRIFVAVRDAPAHTIGKARRISRQDGMVRRLISWFYNLVFRLMYGSFTPDVNGVPKFFSREDLDVLQPTSLDSFIDSELMVKARLLRMQVIEVPVAFEKRELGSSAVRVVGTSWQFVRNLLTFPRRADFREWRRRVGGNGGATR